MKHIKRILPVAALTLLTGSVVYSSQAHAADTTVNSQISSGISLSTSAGSVNVNVLPTGSGTQTIAGHSATVSTNNTTGYSLTLSDSDTNQNLVSGSNNLVPGTGTQVAPATLSAGQWGYRVDGVGGFGAGPTNSVSNGSLSTLTFAGMPASSSANTIATSNAAANQTTQVWYSVAANTSTPVGTYTGTVTYTATTNP